MRDKIAEYIKKQGNAETVYLFGGEPLLYKDTVKYYCENIDAEQIVITTNGTLLDEEFISARNTCPACVHRADASEII